MTYAFQPYPAHRHGPNGALRVVNNADEDAQALAEGFATHPSLVGKPKPADVPKTPAPPPAAVVTPKAAKAPAKPKAQKEPAAAPPPPAATPLEDAIEKAVEAQPAAFDRAVAIAALEAANFEVDPATTDEELVEALAELAK